MFEGATKLIGGNGSEEAEPAHVNSENRRSGPGNLTRYAQHRSVSAEYEEQIYRARERDGFRTNSGANAREFGRDRIAKELAACGADEFRSLLDGTGTRNLAGVADQTDAFDSVSRVFQSTPKILSSQPGRVGEIGSSHASASRSAPRRTPAIRSTRVRGWQCL